MEINKKDIQKWVEALDSGKFGQTCYKLQTINNFCCLGVACKIFIPDKKLQKDTFGEMYGKLPIDQAACPTWLKKVNAHFKKKTGLRLSVLNDGEKLSFGEIATCLELVYIHKILD